MKNNNLKKALITINKIQRIRSQNNKNWMDLVRLAVRLDIKKTSKIISEIYKYDNKIGQLTKKLKKLGN